MGDEPFTNVRLFPATQAIQLEGFPWHPSHTVSHVWQILVTLSYIKLEQFDTHWNWSTQNLSIVVFEQFLVAKI